MVIAVRVAGLELDALFTSQAELLLQIETHAHVRIAYQFEVVAEIPSLAPAHNRSDLQREDPITEADFDTLWAQ
jgi:hypothetical protein